MISGCLRVMCSKLMFRCWSLGVRQSDTLDFISDMATAQYERSGTRASAHPDPNPDPDPSLGSARVAGIHS